MGGSDVRRDRLDVLLAMQAPLRLERMLPQIASIGVDRIVLCGGNKVMSAYWGTHLLRKPVSQAATPRHDGLAVPGWWGWSA